MTMLLQPHLLAQATGPGGTPIWVILIIIFLLLVLFLWGVTNSSGVRGKEPDGVEERHDGGDDRDSEEEDQADTAAAVSAAHEITEPEIAVEPDTVVEDSTENE